MLVTFQDTAKRATDLVIAYFLIALTWPLWIAIAIAVRLTSHGPALYRSPRIGWGGRPFFMLKFRTMFLAEQGQGPRITAQGDPRITSLGRALRRSKLDELPQLINVVRGDMSLVGPRPEAPEFVSLSDDVLREILSVRPGITGPTQLLFQREEEMLQPASVEREYRKVVLPQKLALDLHYVRTRSLSRDLHLLAETAWQLSGGKRLFRCSL